jgi:signal transduction histidine kinase/sugar phosphate isomerase/epimerase
MRFGIQTILWGQNPADYPRMFDIIEDAGFEGVEFFQHPNSLPKLKELLPLLRDRRHPLELLGLADGSLKSRVEYLNQPVDARWMPDGWSPKAPYLYIDEWVSPVEELLRDGYRLAVHPHYLLAINSATEAFNRLEKNPKLLYIPDTAHSALKREDIIKGLSRYSTRLAAVHLKDWRPGFGRLSVMYARGFTELGTGTVDLARVMNYLRDNLKFGGWVVVEQDYTEGLAEKSVQDAARWLADWRGDEPRAFEFYPHPLKQKPIPEGAPPPITMKAVDQFVSQRLASRDVGQLYQRMAESIRESFNLEAVAIWSCSALQRILTLQGLAPAPKTELPDLTVAWEDISGALEADVLEYSRVHAGIRKAIQLPEGGCHALRLPVPSTWNPHHTRIVVDLFACRGWAGDSADSRSYLASSIARAFDSHLDRIAFSVAADLNLDATLAQDEEDFGRRLKALIKRRLHCDGVALFMADPSGTRLLPFVSPELVWNARPHASEQYYEKGDGFLTTEVWQSREPRFRNRHPLPSQSGPHKSSLPTKFPQPHRTLDMPIVDTEGRTSGLVRCVNKLTPAGNVCNFSDDDLVVLDHLLQQAIPTLRLRNAAAEEERRLLIVAHELKRPVAALCGVTELMQADAEDEKTCWSIPERSRKKMISAYRWSENLAALVLRSRYLSGKPEKQFSVVAKRTPLLGDIVAPTIAQLRWELRDRFGQAGIGDLRKFAEKRMKYDDFKAIPPLWVDRNMFQQVFFNLLDNAIKYAKYDPREFQVSITTGDEGRFFTLRITDHGIGIPEGMENLFQLGCRGPESFRKGEGSGVGLWLVRRLLELHNSTIEVEKPRNPTVVLIKLPSKLSKEGWTREDPITG